MNSQSQESDNAVEMQGVVAHDDYDDNAAYFNSLPPGFRFQPSDEELIIHYLHKKINREPLPLNRIRDVLLYRHTPDYLAENYQSYGENQWYFFTPRDRKYKNGSRPNRAAGNGYWKATGADKIIESNDRVIGYRKALVYYVGKAPKGDKSDWIMHEFRVIKSENTPPSPDVRGSNDMTLDYCVLCKMYKKPEKSEVNNTESQTGVLTESQTEDVDTENGVHSDVADPTISNSDSIGLIKPSGGNETLQYNLPPLPSESDYMYTDNYPSQSNINFGYGDPNISVVQPISSMPPTNFIESNHQLSSHADRSVYDDYWDFSMFHQYGWDFKPEDFSMLPQCGEDFRQEDSNMLSQDFSNNFPPIDESLPNNTVDESLPNNTVTPSREKADEQPKSSDSSFKCEDVKINRSCSRFL